MSADKTLFPKAAPFAAAATAAAPEPSLFRAANVEVSRLKHSLALKGQSGLTSAATNRAVASDVSRITLGSQARSRRGMQKGESLSRLTSAAARFLGQAPDKLPSASLSASIPVHLQFYSRFGPDQVAGGSCGAVRAATRRSATSSTTNSKSRGGWTLIESIAVMAVLAIVVAITAPPIIKRVDRAAWTKETADMNAIGDALTQSILRTKSIPTFTNWASAVGNQMSLPVSAVLTNGRRYARAFLIDPMVDINGADLPYTQTINGTTKPNNARVMIVSSLGGPLPNGISSAPQDVPTFQAIWDTPDGGTPAGWTMSGDDLLIRKLNLETLFHQLILFNHDPATNNRAPFSIDRGTTNTVATGPPGWNKYYLENSDLSLFDSNYNLRTRYLMRRSISFVFESGSWRGQIGGGETFTESNSQTASGFLKLASTFYNTPVNPGAGAGASPSAVLVTMYTFMFDYVFWATECPQFTWHSLPTNNTPSNLPEYNLLNDVGSSTSAGSIGKYSGTSGLLK